MIFREIRGTFSRFFAIFAIIAIGVGFFSGVRISTPVLIHTVDEFYKEKQFYDYRLISTLGFEESEAERIRSEEGVRAAEGSWQYDVLCENGAGDVAVLKVCSLTDAVNGLQLVEGHYPESPDECLLDSLFRMDLEVGDTVCFSGENEEDTLDSFTSDHYRVAGFTDSSLFVNFERGTTSLGNGAVSGFLYLPKEAFSNDYYTEIYVKLDSDQEIFSDAYDDLLDANRDRWEAVTQAAADDRYGRLYADAEQELADAKEEFEEKKADGEQELADAKAELDDGAQKLADAEQELADGKAELDDAKAELDDGKKELDDAEAELADGRKKLDDAKAELDSGKKELDDAAGQLADSEAQLDAAKAELGDAKATLDETKEQLDTAKATLDDTKAELDAAKATLDGTKAELDAAKATLDDTKAELDAAKAELDAKKAELDSGKALLDGWKAELDATEQTLNDNLNVLAQQEAQLEAMHQAGLIDDAAYEAGKSEIVSNRAQIENGLVELAASRASYEASLADYGSGLALYEAGLTQYESGKAQYEAGLAQYEEGYAQYEAGLAQYEDGYAQYEDGLARYEAGLAQYEAGLAQYESGKADYESGRARYESGRTSYEEAKAKYESGYADYMQGEADYASGYAEYEQGKADYEDGLRKYEDGVAEYEDGLREYEDARAEYEDGLKEYNDGVETFNSEIADAEQKIRDAEEELADFSAPDTFVLERNTNIAYACFESDSDIVAQVSRVLPVFFILVALLVCMTTMTRMVEEQRGQIGILKGLGYGTASIMRYFMTYSGTAAVLGWAVGYSFGIFLFPAVIWHAYEMMYIPIRISFVFSLKLALITLAVAVICSVGTTYLSLRHELHESAASLLRPRAPKPGKRIFLERIPKLWKRMKFLHKVSARNILRYKKRFFMMVVGIGGCTALLLAGLGLKDTIATFADRQYGEIQIADAELSLKSGSVKEKKGADVGTDAGAEESGDAGYVFPAELKDALDSLGAEYLPVSTSAWDLLAGKQVKSVSVIAPSDMEKLNDYFRLRSTDGTELPGPEEGEAFISVSIAERYHLSPGDTLRIRNSDMKTVTAKVAGIFENYVYNYVILSPELIREKTGEAEMNSLYVTFPEGTDVFAAQTRLAKCGDVSSVMLFAEFRDRITNMMESLNYVVLVIILSAAGLAFVVLYNLTNINILERIREIATIKVLGFYKKETSSYVFRENVVLTCFGILAGIFLGIWLHKFVISQIVVDLVYFRPRITPLSYVLAVILTFAFTVFVNWVMSFRLEKINMAESLKSVE